VSDIPAMKQLQDFYTRDLTEKDAEIERLRVEVKDLAVAFDDAAEGYAAREAAWKAEVEGLRAENRQLRHDGELLEVHDKLAHADKENERLRAALTAYQRNLGDERAEVERLRHLHDGVDDEVRDLRAEVASLRAIVKEAADACPHALPVAYLRAALARDTDGELR
jgi:chromosome segregation ATPase